MANDVSINPLSLDTAVANFAALSLIAGLAVIRAYKIEWFSPTTLAHTFSLQNAQGKVLLRGQCETANVSQVWNFDPTPLLLTKVDGWFLQQISSGTLYIWFR